MRTRRDYGKILYIGLAALATVVLMLILVFHIFRRQEDRLIKEQSEICREYAVRIATLTMENDSVQKMLSGLFDTVSVPVSVTREVDRFLTGLIAEQVAEVEGLEGGFFFRRLDDFLGYAFPTSDPPVPVYGPPPRSYNIIREQALESIRKGQMILKIHAFDPAVFPLATCPVYSREKLTGAVWVRIHVERDLPVAKLKRVLNLFTVIFLVGFVVMAMFSLFLQNGIKSIRKELDNSRKDAHYRLKPRGGWFGFIPASINDMLNLIEKEYEQRQKLERELQQKEKLASLGNMIAGVAHEVKTPLSVIKMRVQMWQKALEENPRLQKMINKDSLDLVVSEINRLSDLVKRLVVFSRPVHDDLKPIRLDHLMDEVVSLVDFENQGKEVTLVKKYDRDIPPVEADGNSLKQVFINVLTNSLESIAGNGEVVIEVKTDHKKETVRISISDTGVGIPADIRDRIFDPFFTSKDTGAGLGLAISHKIVVTHGGSITFEDNRGRGTICVITLPAYKHNEGYPDG